MFNWGRKDKPAPTVVLTDAQIADLRATMVASIPSPILAPIPELPKPPLKYPAVVVYLPAGGLGVVNHIKSNGMLGVRPVDDNGNYFQNLSAHWSEEQRKSIPHELAIHISQLKPVVNLPLWATES